MIKIHSGCFLIVTFFVWTSCSPKRKTTNDNMLQISSLEYLADTTYLKSIMDSILPSGYKVGDLGYKNFTRRYLKMEIKNCSTDTIYLQGFEFSRFAIDTLLTKSITVLGAFNESSNSFDSIIRPITVKDYYAYDNIIIKPNGSAQKLVEDDTEIDLTKRRLKLKVRFKIKRNNNLVNAEEIVLTKRCLNEMYHEVRIQVHY